MVVLVERCCVAMSHCCMLLRVVCVVCCMFLCVCPCMSVSVFVYVFRSVRQVLVTLSRFCFVFFVACCGVCCVSYGVVC